MFIPIGVTVGKKQDVVNPFGVETLADFIKTGFKPLINFRSSTGLYHLDPPRQFCAVALIGGRDQYFGMVAESHHAEYIFRAQSVE